MKRILALGVCLLLCAALFCGCDGARGNDVSVDINALIHTLDEFPKGDFKCLVTVEKKGQQTATGTDGEKEVPVTYLFEGQEAVNLYNLMNRTEWETGTVEVHPTGEFQQMVTLDYYSGKSAEDAQAYYGSFTISNRDDVIASPSPISLSMAAAQAAKGTYDALWSYITEKGEADE